jgi:hypothetical protein
MQRALARLSLLTVLAGLTACSNPTQHFLTPGGMAVIQLAMPADTPPIAMSRESALFSVEEDVMFPIVPPTDAQMSALDSAMDPAPFTRAPWVSRGDVEVEIDLVITNVGMDRVTATATINGISEFNRYLPGFSINDNAIVPDFSQWERTWSLRPGERQTITVREEQMDEVATDLASVVNTAVTFGPPDPMTMMAPTCSDIANEIVYFANQATIDPRSTMCIPHTIPGLVGFVLGLRAVGEPGSTAPPVAIEASVRLRDVNHRVMTTGTPWELPETPVPFTPPMTIQ